MPEWVFQAVGVVLALASLILLGWALLWDRARGRVRCPKCWYDMSGVSTSRCPECGRDWSARALRRTRRRFGWAAAGLVILAAAWPSSRVPQIQKAGFPGAVPTTILIWWVGRFEPPEAYTGGRMSTPTSAAQELARRCAGGELYGWQWRLLIRHLDIIRWRDRWPEGLPWQVAVSPPWWLRSAGCDVRLELPSHLWHIPSYPPGNTAAETSIRSLGFPIATQPLRPGEEVIPAQVNIGPWSGTMRLRVRQVARVEDSITPVSDPSLDAGVRQALHVSIRADLNLKTETDHVVVAELSRTLGIVPEDLAVALTVELLHDGNVVMSFNLPLQESAFGEPGNWIRFAMPEPGWDTNDPADMARWSVRVRGDPVVALDDALRKRCWGGEFTMSLDGCLY